MDPIFLSPFLPVTLSSLSPSFTPWIQVVVLSSFLPFCLNITSNTENHLRAGRCQEGFGRYWRRGDRQINAFQSARIGLGGVPGSPDGSREEVGEVGRKGGNGGEDSMNDKIASSYFLACSRQHNTTGGSTSGIAAWFARVSGLVCI